MGVPSPTMLDAAPACIQVGYFWFVDKSPRRQYYKNRGEEAYGILVKHYANGYHHDPLVQAEEWEMGEALKVEM